MYETVRGFVKNIYFILIFLIKLVTVSNENRLIYDPCTSVVLQTSGHVGRLPIAASLKLTLIFFSVRIVLILDPGRSLKTFRLKSSRVRAFYDTFNPGCV